MLQTYIYNFRVELFLWLQFFSYASSYIKESENKCWDIQFLSRAQILNSWGSLVIHKRPTNDGNFSPGGSSNVKCWNIVVKNRNSSILAKASPRHTLLPAITQNNRFVFVWENTISNFFIPWNSLIFPWFPKIFPRFFLKFHQDILDKKTYILFKCGPHLPLG